MSDKYDDIINLPHFVSKNRNHMSNHDRAAQFAPFAALNGFGESISEAARLVDEKIELGEQEIQKLNNKFELLEMNIKNKPKVILTYFVKDINKNGGAYYTQEVTVKKIDMIERLLISDDKQKYHLDDIYDIEGDFFKQIDNIFI